MDGEVEMAGDVLVLEIPANKGEHLLLPLGKLVKATPVPKSELSQPE